MYPYHNRIKQRIANGELIDAELVEDWPRIGRALVLRFCTAPAARPIREHRWDEYRQILSRAGFAWPGEEVRI